MEHILNKTHVECRRQHRMKNYSLQWLPFLGMLLGGVLLGLQGCAERPPTVRAPLGERTVQDVLDLYGPAAEQRVVPYFHRASVPYPPAALAFLGFKAEKRLEVWARHQDAWVFILAYGIEAASGTAGPKLREGDYQVPEGLYAIEALNPNSRFHLSLKLDYPNAVDRQQAALEGREQLGGDIFLHGKDVSVGCLAMGDVVIEELFVLVARTGIERVIVLLAPYDFRQRAVGRDSSRPMWVEALYEELRRELSQFTRTPP
jgi:hypothetical protein